MGCAFPAKSVRSRLLCFYRSFFNRQKNENVAINPTSLEVVVGCCAPGIHTQCHVAPTHRQWNFVGEARANWICSSILLAVLSVTDNHYQVIAELSRRVDACECRLDASLGDLRMRLEGMERSRPLRESTCACSGRVEAITAKVIQRPQECRCLVG